jgi:hypothetical protein
VLVAAAHDVAREIDAARKSALAQHAALACTVLPSCAST